MIRLTTLVVKDNVGLFYTDSTFLGHATQLYAARLQVRSETA